MKHDATSSLANYSPHVVPQHVRAILDTAQTLRQHVERGWVPVEAADAIEDLVEAILAHRDALTRALHGIERVAPPPGWVACTCGEPRLHYVPAPV